MQGFHVGIPGFVTWKSQCARFAGKVAIGMLID